MFRKWFAILMISVYAFANTELHQLLKFPVLMHHFIEHRAETPGITLTQFLYIHYILPQPHDKDYDRDMQLPFKTDVCSVFHIAIPLLQPVPINTQQQRHYYIVKTYPLHHTSFPTHGASSDIWQPPRA